MTIPVDLPLLEALRGPSVSLLTRTRVKAAGSGEVYTGFSTLDRLNVALRVDDVSGETGSSVTVLVEHSDDGLVWETAATHTFTANGTYRVVVEAPKDQLRASWTVTADLRDAFIGSVAVVPGSIDAASDGGADPANAITLESTALVDTTAVNGFGYALWSAIYDRDGNTISEIPAAMGLALNENLYAISVLEAGIWSLNLIFNPIDDPTAIVDAYLGCGDSYSGGPRLVDCRAAASPHEFALSCTSAMKASNVIITFDHRGTATAGGYTIVDYATLEIVRLA